MLSCPERAETRAETLRSLAVGNWPTPRIVLDNAAGPTSADRLNAAWLRVLGFATLARSDFVLLCEDDLIFGYWFLENLRSWPALDLTTDGFFFASLYNHGHGRLSGGSERHWVADPFFSWGNQALVMTPKTACAIVANWAKGQGAADVRMARLAAAFSPIFHHRPSLVQHARGPSTWGAVAHEAPDFELFWRASDDAHPLAAEPDPGRPRT